MSVVVAGGTRGIGLELAESLTEPGESVVLGYGSDHESAEAAAERLVAAGRVPLVVQADMATPEGSQALARIAAEVGEPVRVAVHCSVQVVPGALVDLDLDDLDRTLAVNGTSLLWLTRAMAPLMQRGSSVLYLTSRGSTAVVGGYGTVGPAKAYAEALMRYLAVELAPQGIRVNALAPGTQDTQALRAVFGDKTDEIIEAQRAKNPSGRLVTPDDYCGVARMLVGPESTMVTGQTVFVYGGANLMG